MVLTTQLIGAPLRFTHDRCTAVLTRVVEGAKFSVVSAHNDDRHLKVVESEVIARIRDVFFASGHHPDFRPQVFLLEIPEFVGDVAVDRYVVKGGETLGVSLALELRGHFVLDAFDQ